MPGAVRPGAEARVSPITIRLRILKGIERQQAIRERKRVSPITIRLRILKVDLATFMNTWHRCFTHHDPLEDTESGDRPDRVVDFLCFTHHDPLEDTERRKK